jgi:MtN3 and saliva related transmembrane protein
MTPTELIGYAAACCTTFSFVPQAIKALKEHDTRSLSLGMYITFSVGVALWDAYGILRRDWVLILPNTITLGFCALILGAKLRNDVLGAKARGTRPEA